VVQSIHTAVKGRARYKVNQLYGSKSLKAHLERSLSDLPKVHEVFANSLTGNILVLFDPSETVGQIASLIQTAVIDYQNQQQQSQTESLPASPEELKETVADAEVKKAESQQLVTANAC
jgi:P-type Ca2+ transporter type 2C